MAVIHLVRHGHSPAEWIDGGDPELDARGRRQAAWIASAYGRRAPVTLLCSPLRRARQTAAGIAEQWGASAAIEPAIAEIPPPVEIPPDGRAAYVASLTALSWAEVDAARQAWRDRLLERIDALSGPVLLVTHLVVINVLVGRATGEERAVFCFPRNCSTTIIDTDGAWTVLRRAPEFIPRFRLT